MKSKQPNKAAGSVNTWQSGIRKISQSLTRDMWIVLLDIIAVNAAYYLALMIRFFDFQGTVAAFRT